MDCSHQQQLIINPILIQCITSTPLKQIVNHVHFTTIQIQIHQAKSAHWLCHQLIDTHFCGGHECEIGASHQ